MEKIYTGPAGPDVRTVGLTEEEARRRLARYGRNELKSAPPPGLWRRLWEQLRDPMIPVLLAAAAISLLAGGGTDWADAAVILVIVAVNAAVALIQEDGARRSLAALEKLSGPRARLLRDGREVTVDAALTVPGDVMVLRAGDRIAADGRLLTAVGLRVDESALTGESVPVDKASRAGPDADGPDGAGTVSAGTVVTAGRGTAVVTATGMDSAVGRIAALVQGEERRPTPMQRRMGEVSAKLSVLCIGVCALTFLLGLVRGLPPAQMFLTSVSLAVAALPEGLPAVVSIVLAMGVRSMAGRGAVIRRLNAVETLGCTQVVCSDKTGTLTQNRMTASEVWTPDGGTQTALLCACLCSDARPEPGGAAAGDPTETALLRWASEQGADPDGLRARWPRVGEIPFDSGRKRMTTVHEKPGGGWRIVVKGAPELLLPLCVGPTAAAGRRNAGMAKSGLRVLALAWRDVTELPERLTPAAAERELTLAGLVGLLDPPRPEAAAAVVECRRAGVRTVMITGDHRDTAAAVARQIGILRPGELVVTGQELDFLPPRALEEELGAVSVFARVTPEHKLRIVRAFKARGEIVAMTGDGVNDAPALRSADVGCAMGRGGTDVARAAADVVLTDDNFATVARAVAEGRGVYANVTKAIHYLLSCNVGEVLTVFLAAAAGLSRLPLQPVQLLWINLVTDALPALALGRERPEEDAMARPPRRADAPLFDRAFTLRLAWQGAMIGGLALLAFWLGRAVMPLPGRADETAGTMAFTVLTLSQLIHAFNCRSDGRSLRSLGILSNPAMVRAFLIGLALLLAVTCLAPLRPLFGTVALGARQWLTAAALSAAPLPVCELAKLLARRRGAPGRRVAQMSKKAACGFARKAV